MNANISLCSKSGINTNTKSWKETRVIKIQQNIMIQKITSCAFGIFAILAFTLGLTILFNQPFFTPLNNHYAFLSCYVLGALNTSLFIYTQKLLSSN